MVDEYNVCVYESSYSPSKLTFTIFEDPLTPSLTERPLVRVNYPQYLQLPAHQVSAPIWSSTRQQAGRQAGVGKVLDTCGTLIT